MTSESNKIVIELKANNTNEEKSTEKHANNREKNNKKTEEENGQERFMKSVESLAISESKHILNYCVNQYGSLTGNYVMQGQLNNISTIAGFAMSAFSAIATGNPAGLIIQAISLGHQGVQYAIQRNEAQNRIDFIQDRTEGVLINGSRDYSSFKR